MHTTNLSVSPSPIPAESLSKPSRRPGPAPLQPHLPELAPHSPHWPSLISLSFYHRAFVHAIPSACCLPPSWLIHSPHSAQLRGYLLRETLLGLLHMVDSLLYPLMAPRTHPSVVQTRQPYDIAAVLYLASASCAQLPAPRSSRRSYFCFCV